MIRHSGVRLSGQVLDAAGGFVPHASIRVTTRDASPRVTEASAAEEGRFEVWLAPAEVMVEVHARGYAQQAASVVTPPLDDLQIVLVPASSIVGRTVAYDTGLGVTDVIVRAVATGAQQGPSRYETLAGSDGSFEFDSLEPGRYTLLAEGDAMRSVAHPPLALGLGERVGPLTISMRSVARVSGQVVISGRRGTCRAGSVLLYAPPPVAGIRRDVDSLPRLSAPIDQDGWVRFASVPAGRYAVEVNCEGHASSSEPAPVVVESHDLAGLIWEVTPGGYLSIDVRDEHDRPVPRAELTVAAVPAESGVEPTLFPHTADAQGHCDVGPLRVGRYVVAPYEPGSGASTEVELTDTKHQAVARLRLSGTGSLEVATTTEAGTPVSTGLLVSASASSRSAQGGAHSARMIAPGIYQLAPLTAGDYLVEVNDGVNPRFTTEARVDDAGTTRVHVVVERSSQIRGRVLDSDGAPVPDAWVEAHFEQTGDQGGDRLAEFLLAPGRSMTDPSGEFVVTNLAPGAHFRLLARSSDGESLAVANSNSGLTGVILTMSAVGKD